MLVRVLNFITTPLLWKALRETIVVFLLFMPELGMDKVTYPFFWEYIVFSSPLLFEQGSLLLTCSQRITWQKKKTNDTLVMYAGLYFKFWCILIIQIHRQTPFLSAWIPNTIPPFTLGDLVHLWPIQFHAAVIVPSARHSLVAALLLDAATAQYPKSASLCPWLFQPDACCVISAHLCSRLSWIKFHLYSAKEIQNSLK